MDLREKVVACSMRPVCCSHRSRPGSQKSVTSFTQLQPNQATKRLSQVSIGFANGSLESNHVVIEFIDISLWYSWSMSHISGSNYPAYGRSVCELPERAPLDMHRLLRLDSCDKKISPPCEFDGSDGVAGFRLVF